jgi:dTDP-glucose 4,6-dehydratase
MRDANVTGIRIVYGSVNDPEIMEKVVPGHDAIVHLAAWASVDVSLDRPRPSLMINGVGTATLLDQILACGERGVRTIVSSSCEVYGSAIHRRLPVSGYEREPIPQDEDTAMAPRSPYAASKIVTDRLAYAYAVSYDLNLSIVRPANVYGPGQRAGAGGAVIPTLTRAALTGEPLTLTGGGYQTREWLHIDDLVTAYTILLDRVAGEPGEAFNLGTGETRSIRDIALALCQLTGTAGSRLQEVLARPADVTAFLLNSAKARAAFGWSPQVKFDDGLARYVEWARGKGTLAWQ